MRISRETVVSSLPVIVRIVLVVTCLGAIALGLAAPDDWGYGGWVPRHRP